MGSHRSAMTGSMQRTSLLLFCLLLATVAAQEDLPEPRLVIIGQTGAGKSTLANVLLGESPDCKNCTFAVCDGHDSCTKQTKYKVGTWLGSGPTFTIVDTPGFGDSDNEDTELIDEMMGALHSVIKGANAMVFLINGQDERFDASMQQMIREMQALFGEEFWLHTVIGVSHWAFDEKSVAQRNFTGKTEDKLMAEWNELLRSKFHITEELEGVFIDSYSQQPWNLPDPLQQEAFQRETEKLWTFVQEHDVFPFRTIADVLEENQDLKEEVKWLNDVITENITKLTNQIASLSSNHTEDVEGLRNEISDVVSPPLGTIIAWTTKPSLDTPPDISEIDLPEGWVRCNGETIPHPSKWAGYPTPDLNGGKKFLRGGTDSSELTMEDHNTRLPDHTHTAKSSASATPKSSANATATSEPHEHYYSDTHIGDHDCNMASGDYWCIKHDTRTTTGTKVEVTVEVDVIVEVEVDVDIVVEGVENFDSFD